MRYWEEMKSKHGFDGGDAIPDGVAEYRTAYIAVVNALAQHGNSNYRVSAFNRSGMHNWCIILVVPLSVFLRMPERLISYGEDPDHVWFQVIPEQRNPRPDDAFNLAVSRARNLVDFGYDSVDALVDVKVKLRKGDLKSVLKSLETCDFED